MDRGKALKKHLNEKTVQLREKMTVLTRRVKGGKGIAVKVLPLEKKKLSDL